MADQEQAPNGNINGKWSPLIRILEALVIAGVTGIVCIYGTSARLDATVCHLSESIKEMKGDIKELRTSIDTIKFRQLDQAAIARGK